MSDRDNYIRDLENELARLREESKRNYDIAVKAQAQLFEVEAERDRLREALVEITRVVDKHGVGWTSALTIARNALKEDS